MDVQDDLERSTKFIYLAQYLEGEPKEMISGLAITDDNYTIAVHILRECYDNAPKTNCQPLSIILRIFEIS